MYGCQLWYKGKQAFFVCKLQMVQNEAVRIISGSFRTAPHKPLHQLLSILPIDLQLNMLTKTYTLRLYRLPRASQPLKRLQEPWSEKTAKDLPLPAPQWKSAKTALKWLASCVLAKGLHIETFPLAPQNGPNQNGQLTCQPEGLQGIAILLGCNTGHTAGDLGSHHTRHLSYRTRYRCGVQGYGFTLWHGLDTVVHQYHIKNHGYDIQQD
jgi:hypothetical protein